LNAAGLKLVVTGPNGGAPVHPYSATHGDAYQQSAPAKAVAVAPKRTSNLTGCANLIARTFVVVVVSVVVRQCFHSMKVSSLPSLVRLHR
jgi:hypothetical protein